MPEPLRRLRPDEPVVVAIPTKNRPAYLAALLTSLLYQSYPRWTLVVNDSSDTPVADEPTVADLLVLIRSSGHEVVVVRSETGWDRHQRAMAAAPAGVELLVRVDDDVIFTPTYLESVLQPFHLCPDRPLAAVGGCVPEGQYPAMDLPPATALRYRLCDLEQGRWRPHPMQSWVGRLKHRRHAFLRRVKQELLKLARSLSHKCHLPP